MKSKEYTSADICEKAHELTVRDCKKLGITVDCPSALECGDESQSHDDEGTHYTDKAQAVFDAHFDRIESEFEEKKKRAHREKNARAVFIVSEKGGNEEVFDCLDEAFNHGKMLVEPIYELGIIRNWYMESSGFINYADHSDTFQTRVKINVHDEHGILTVHCEQ